MFIVSNQTATIVYLCKSAAFESLCHFLIFLRSLAVECRSKALMYLAFAHK